MTLFFILATLFTGVWLTARIFGAFRFFTKGIKDKMYDVSRDWNYQPMITMMIPCYNEGQVVCDTFNSILKSDYPREKIEIIAVDDYSKDDTWKWLQYMRDQFPNNIVVWKNEVNKGKPMTLAAIARRAKGEIVITTDSDSILEPQSVKELLSCFADPEIGGVGGFPLCRNINDSVWTSMQGVLFATFFYKTKVFENFFGISRVLCGPLSAFRKEIFLEIGELVEKRSFMGLTDIRRGDDTFITVKMCLGDGISKRWKAYNNFNARVWANQPATMMGYLKQQLRWWRSRSVTFELIGNLPQILKTGGLLAFMITNGVTFISLSGLLMVVCAIYLGILLPLLIFTLLVGSILGILMCLLYNRSFGRHNTISGEIKHPYITGVWFGIYCNVMMLVLNVIAIFTWDDGGSVTRTNGSNISQT